MENQIDISNYQTINGHLPIKICINNLTNSGRWVDLFRHKQYHGIKINCHYGTFIADEISYEEFVDAFKKESFLIGRTSIYSAIPFHEIEKENQNITIINWDVRGIVATISFKYPDPINQEQNASIEINEEYMIDHSTFVRIWSPANSNTIISFFTKK